MAKRGDNSTPRSVKGEFDENDCATSHGGAVLIERALRRLGIRRLVGNAVDPRHGVYQSEEIVLQVIAGLLLGGKGFQATAPLALDGALPRVLGFENIASAPTVYRAMCELAGLGQRKHGDVYKKAGASLPAMDMFGGPRKPAARRRVVSGSPESAGDESVRMLDGLVSLSASAALKRLRRSSVDLQGYTPVFGDGTDLEVRGACFDAARRDRNGNMSLRAMSVMMGPVMTALSILPGSTDEGKSLPALLEKSGPAIRKASGKRPVMALLDAAFAESEVVKCLEKMNWKYIICANQYRSLLERMAGEQPEAQWRETGPDAARGWSQSAVMLMTHTPEGWEEPVTVVARRYRKEGEIVDRYSFLYTNLSGGDFPRSRTDKHGLASFLWQLYGTKQGRENHFKTLLNDLGMHHPPSGRLGATQAFAALAAVAANVHAFVAYRVVPKEDRGIRLWRFLRDYIQIAGRVVMRPGRRLLVRLAGGGLPGERKARWLMAQEALEGT